MRIKEKLENWFSEIAERSGFSLMDVPLSRSGQWHYRDGAIRHRSGKFFSIVGVSVTDPSGNVVQQPMIDQREIGILGFVMREKNGQKEVLAHAKLEPGNVGPVQIAPTCQATASNMARAHGGEDPPFSGVFARGAFTRLSDSLQSEQGTRFLGKKNRNVLADIGEDIDHGVLHRWMKIEDILGLIDQDFIINTDARSVLITCPWKKISAAGPFERNASGFGLDLLGSLKNESWRKGAESALNEISRLRACAKRPVITDVKSVEGWQFNEEGKETLSGEAFSVRHIWVRAGLREVAEWDQPIIDSHGEGAVELMCGRINGVLHFAFKPQIEPGLVNLVEIGPTFTVEPGMQGLEEPLPYRGRTVVGVKQSEEGGRFFRDVNHYRIVDIGEADPALQGYFWLTLRDVQRLLLEGNWFTNEARSVLSLLLKWL